jgi:putative transposase
MQKKRTRYSEEFKTKVALEAIREQSTINEIAGKYQLHANQVSTWKKQLLEGAEKIFEDPRKKQKENGPTEDELYHQIGQLQMQLEWLKKKMGIK